MSTKSEIEARRGIVRDEDGKIIRSKEWLEQRIEMLKAKETDLQNRIKNIKAELKTRTQELDQ
jgi:chaperonin cofactor prefoldin